MSVQFVLAECACGVIAVVLGVFGAMVYRGRETWFRALAGGRDFLDRGAPRSVYLKVARESGAVLIALAATIAAVAFWNARWMCAFPDALRTFSEILLGACAIVCIALVLRALVSQIRLHRRG